MRKSLSRAEIDEHRYKWGLPDWQKPDQYENVDRLNNTDLRWQFLRRDQTYRKDWLVREPYGFMKYGIYDWHDPSTLDAPNYLQPCYLIDFIKSGTAEQLLHYAALADGKGLGSFIFNVDGNSPLKPQLAVIAAVHERYARNASSRAERRKREKRKSNVNGRSPSFLLRVLDAHSEGLSLESIAEIFGGEDGITEAAMRRTLNFAKGYWQRF